MRNAIFALLALSLFAVGANAQNGERTIRAVNCSVRYINKVDVPAKADGPVMELNFEEGDAVTVGDVLAIIEDTAAKLAVDLKKAEEKEAILTASNDINLKDAVNSERVAKAEYEAFKELHREGALPYWEMEKKRLEAERQKLRIGLAEMEQKIALVKRIAKQTELDMAEFELTKRKVTAPATGFIEKRIAQIGQWVQAGSPIATLIQMDKLRVEGDIDALSYPGNVAKGTRVEVTVYQGDREVKVDGVIGYISMEVDLNDNNKIWVEIENEKFGTDWKFKPGMKADIAVK
ncbi:HlyD family efflux transporter periplasmic adaptor subunit [Rubripirellula amarantea]|uniref:Multidrug resistance protein MdtN n=1 Tax=Rubripirellula amarantea TaxID=2527999 RepID=A0A5C5WSN8_9BACT|nr:HlyD family efflux transporter periplasmic adaptor subunit [Rubripirellula amarantea]MDA8745071.1 HlyD family efflux transporter periplasmic adaptor subunit [Rubripirellula amarantea]TWT53944.1 multidrug resistance protein MdtN [Rubripirellula amarantea]